MCGYGSFIVTGLVVPLGMVGPQMVSRPVLSASLVYQ